MIGTLNTVRKLRSGDILVELSSSSQIKAITKLKHIMDRPVTVIMQWCHNNICQVCRNKEENKKETHCYRHLRYCQRDYITNIRKRYNC